MGGVIRRDEEDLTLVNEASVGSSTRACATSSSEVAPLRK